MQNSPGDSPSSSQESGITNDPEIESEFCYFYERILIELHALYRVDFVDIKNSLRIIRSYKNPDAGELDTVSFDEDANRLAYIFAYSVIHSVVVFHHVSNMLTVNPTMLKKIASMIELRLCILGGGSGFEAVAVCKCIREILEKQCDKEISLQVTVTIIDKYNAWEKDANLIITSAQQSLCSSSKVDIQVSFIKADITNEISEDVKKILKKSHIVTMFKFLSVVNDEPYSRIEIPRFAHEIIDCMSFKACLIFLDTAGGGFFNIVDRIINDSLPQTSRIYGPCRHNCHMLSMDTVQEFSKALGAICRYLKCTERTTVSCSAWVKVRHRSNIESSIKTLSIDDTLDESETHKFKMKSRRLR